MDIKIVIGDNLLRNYFVNAQSFNPILTWGGGGGEKWPSESFC